MPLTIYEHCFIAHAISTVQKGRIPDAIGNPHPKVSPHRRVLPRADKYLQSFAQRVSSSVSRK